MPTAKRKLPPAATAQADPPPPDAAMQVLRQFRLVFNTARKHFREVEKNVGLGAAQVWALGQVRDRPGIRVSELAEAMDVHQSTASNLVRGLLARELVRTRQGQQDRRSVQLFIRPAGRAILKTVPGPFSGVLPAALRELDEDTLRRLAQDLQTLLGHLQADDADARMLLAHM